MMVWSWLLEWWEAGWVQAPYKSLLQLLVAELGNRIRAAWGEETIKPGAALAKGDLAVTELSVFGLRDHLLSLDCPWDLGDTGSECAEQYEDSQGLPGRLRPVLISWAIVHRMQPTPGPEGKGCGSSWPWIRHKTTSNQRKQMLDFKKLKMCLKWHYQYSEERQPTELGKILVCVCAQLLQSCLTVTCGL